MDYRTAETEIATARNPDNGKPLANNTRLFRRGDDFAIRFHSTDVVTIHRDGTYTLNSGGWRTLTTKARMNDFSPARIYSTRGTWNLYAGGEPVALYCDGIRIGSDGRPLNPPSAKDSAEYTLAAKRVDSMIREYIRGFVAAIRDGKIGAPSVGDCWGCYFVQAGKDNGNAKNGVLGFDHILSHFRERYFVPSLLWRAMQRRGNPAFVWALVTGEGTRERHADMAASDLRSYLRGIRPQLIDEVIAGRARAQANFR